MAQHDYNIANQSGQAFRADLNNALAAIVSGNSGASAPSTTYAYQYWVDTASSPALLKQRNASNNAWVTLGPAGENTNTLLFTQSGAGAVPRTIDSRLKETVSVKDFGAVGDGVSDDYAAFQACASYAAGLSKTLKQVVQVYVPSGDYLLSQQVIFNVAPYTQTPLGISLQGDSCHSSRLIASAANTTGCIKFTSDGNTELWSVRDLAFLSPLAYNAATNNGTALYVESTIAPGAAGFGTQNNHTVIIENVFIGPYVAGGSIPAINDGSVGNFYRGIDLRNKWFPKLSNVFITGGPPDLLESSMTGKDSAIYAQSCYSPFFNSVYISGLYKVGINLNMLGGMEDFRIDGCTIVNPLKCIYIYHPDSVVSTGLYEPGGIITNCHLAPQRFGLHLNFHRQVNIADNFIYIPILGTNLTNLTSRPSGFWLDGVGDIIVANNQFLESAATDPVSEDVTQCCVKISQRAEGILITDNVFNSKGTGVYIESSASYGESQGEVVVSNSTYRGMGYWDLSYKVTDKTSGGIAVTSDWWDNGLSGSARKTYKSNFAPTAGASMYVETIANRTDYATKSDAQIFDDIIYGRLSDGSLQGITYSYQWVNNSSTAPVIQENTYHITRNNANTANEVRLLHQVANPQSNGETSLGVLFKDSGTVSSLRKVLVGPVDSAGTGYRYLRITN